MEKNSYEEELKKEGQLVVSLAQETENKNHQLFEMEPEYNETCSHDKKLVWPWTAVVVNIPTKRTEGRQFVGESGTKLRDQLRSRGFNPLRVHLLWNDQDHSGSAVVEFNKDWPGLHNALSFEKAYEAKHHGKKDWYYSGNEKSGLYAWVACADDYNSNGIIGEHLRKTGNLKTVSEIIEEEARKQDKLVSNLTNIIQVKSKHLKEMEQGFTETTMSLQKVIGEKDRLIQAYNEDIQRARDHYQRVLNDNEKLKLELESQKRELQLHVAELEKLEAQIESENKKLSEEIEKRMGELDSKPFHEAMKRKYNEEEAEDRASELCSLWEEILKDPEWNPFKVVMVKGKHEEVIDDKDVKLRGLRSEMGDEVYKAVIAALVEINEYNPSGRHIISELWNYGEGRKARVQEGVTQILKQWKMMKRKRQMV